jgi:hypothetical protein
MRHWIRHIILWWKGYLSGLRGDEPDFSFLSRRH